MAARLFVVACLVMSVPTISTAAHADTVGQIVNWVSKSAKKLTTGSSKASSKKSRKARSKSPKSNAKSSKAKVKSSRKKSKKGAPEKSKKAKSYSGSAKSAAKAPSIAIPPLPERRDKTETGTSKNSTATVAPKPDVWTPQQISAARKTCADVLKRVNAITIPRPAIKKGACGDPAPVELVSVGKNPPVTFSPPAKVNCQMVEALHKWTTKHLQPLAKKHLKARLIKIDVMSDYSCRRAYGRKNGRMSEHSKVNALDIRGFVTTKGNVARLLAHWGPTKRDIARAIAEKKKAEEKRKKEIAAQQERDRKIKAAAAEVNRAKSNSAKSGTVKTSKIATEDIAEVGEDTATKPAYSAAPNKLGGPPPGQPKFSPPKTAKGRFLRGAHISGCRIFGTILGPEANNAHRNHFHVDMAPRKRSNFCQ